MTSRLEATIWRAAGHVLTTVAAAATLSFYVPKPAGWMVGAAILAVGAVFSFHFANNAAAPLTSTTHSHPENR